MAEINDLSVTDANNTARFPENMAPSAVNNGARALEGIVARWYQDANGSVATTGSSNAYVMAANQTLTAYYDGLILAFDANHANTGAATLNVDSLGAKTIKKRNDQDLASGDIEAGQKCLVIYDGTNFQLLSQVAVADAATDSDNNFTADQTIVSTDAGATEGPGFNLYRNSASPAASDVLGALRWKGEDDGSNETTYAKLLAVIDDATGGSEDGRLKVVIMQAGTLTDAWHFGLGFYAEGNTDPGAGNIDADQLSESGARVMTMTPSYEGVTATLTANTTYDLAHGLTSVVSLDCFFECDTDDVGFVTGDLVPISFGGSVRDNTGWSIHVDGTNVTLALDNQISIVRPDTNASATMTLGSWKFRARAWGT